MLYNVLDFESIDGRDAVQLALDSALSGDRIYFPGGRFYQAPPGGWIISKSLELFGDGPGNLFLKSGSVLVPNAINPSDGDHIFVLDPFPAELHPTELKELSHVYIHDLQLTSSIAGTKQGAHGVLFVNDAFKKLSSFKMERVCISWMKKCGMFLNGYNGGNGAMAQSLLRNCSFSSCGAQGLRLTWSYANLFVGCVFEDNGSDGLLTEGFGEFAIYGCTFRNNLRDPTAGGIASLNANGPGQLRIDACSIEQVYATHSTVLIRIFDAIGSGYLSGCRFKFDQFNASTKAVQLEHSTGAVDPAAVLCILPNVYDSVGAVFNSIAPDLRGIILFPQSASTDQTELGTLPSSAGVGTTGVPTMQGATNRQSGFLIPSFASNPTSNIQDGMLAFVGPTQPRTLRVWAPVAPSPAAWHDVSIT